MKKQDFKEGKKYHEGYKEEGKHSKEFSKKELHEGYKGERKQKKEKYEEWGNESEVKVKKMVFLNPYKSKFADFVTPLISNNSNYYTKNWNDGMNPPKETSKTSKPLSEELGKKYKEFVNNLDTITQGVAEFSENASLESVKQIYRNINQKSIWSYSRAKRLLW